MTGALIGLATSSKNASFAHDAMMIGFAQNSDYKANMAVYTDPSYDTTAWTSGYRSAFSTPDYKFMMTVMQIIDQELLAVGAFPGYPVQQSQAFGLVEPYDPMNLVFNEIQFKRDRVTVKEALQHACTIIDFLTLPPCTKEYLEVYVSDVPGSNKGDLMYRWPANSVNKTCRLGVAKALTQLPEPIRMALPLKYTSIYSVQAQVMVALSAIGIVFELLLAFLFLLKSRTQVIKAASVKASLTIFIGACLTLSSVIMRVTSTDGNGWFQCWGTYYAFAVGFGLVLGSLAIKSYRISYIFNNSKKSMNTSLSDRKLMGLIASVALIEIVLCLILEFALADPSTVRYVELPGLSSTVEQYDCPTSHMGGVVALYIFNVLLIIGAAYFAFKTRNVIAAFNENVFTSAAILLISVVTIVIVPVLTLITSSVAIFMLIALGTIIATVLSTAIFGVPKILIAFEVLHMAGVSGTLRASTAMTGGGASSVHTNERSARGKGHSAEPSAGDVRAVKTAALSPVGVRTSKVGSVIVDAYRDSVQKGSDEDA
ncbi:Metabotropic glutamate receptor 1 [Rhizophlyctis rosea]|uniref:Metabotropic glutamate receptor 1 n=1 Tax=Rhizophlyctis rosea TaxID=64517 RepID=A0AAD5SG39_9FUNG|nr:Metabotropic glutamate receptor 1 [Rhizophlyctis rosea]